MFIPPKLDNLVPQVHEKIWRQKEIRICRKLKRRITSRSITKNSKRPWRFNIKEIST
jgi:hypothetical protein